MAQFLYYHFFFVISEFPMFGLIYMLDSFLFHSHFEGLSLLLPLEATEMVSQMASQMVVELITITVHAPL